MSLHSRHMTQRRNTASTCAPQWKMWLFKVFGVIYTAAVCASQESIDASTYSYQTATQPMTTLYVPPQPNLQLASNQVEFFPSENVELSCSVTRSVELTFMWKKNGAPLGPSDPNFSWSPDKSVLTIQARSQQDSGAYSCAVQGKTTPSETKESNIISVKVYGSIPKPTLTRDANFNEMFPGESITFSCSVSVSSGWEYVWYHGANEIKTSDTYSIPSIIPANQGQYSCKARRGQTTTGASESTTLVVSQPPTPLLRLQTTWTDVFEKETVEFLCQVTSLSTGWTFTWFRDTQPVQNDTVQIVTKGGSSLTITSVSQTHKGQYTCKAHLTPRRVSSGFSNELTIKVNEIPVPIITERPQWTEVFPTESVTFSCGMQRDSSNWIYTWHKDKKQVLADGDVSFDVNGAKLSIRAASADHAGRYECTGQLQNRAVTSKTSSELHLSVHGEKPTLTLTKDPDYQVMFATESVTFSCAISVPSQWQYLWFKDGAQLIGSSSNYTVNIRGTADGGSYMCKAKRGQNPSFTTDLSKAIQLQVKGENPILTLKQDPDYQVMFATESVTFSCAISVPSQWQYLWFKDGAQLPGSSSNYTVKIRGTADGGSYTCQAKRGQSPSFATDLSKAIQLQVKENKPKPSVTQRPDDKKLYMGEPMSYECNVDISSGWSYEWHKNGTFILSSQSLHINNLSWSNSGAYKCIAKRSKTSFSTEFSEQQTLPLHEIPVPAVKPVTQWLDVFPTESVTMSCGMKQDATDWTYAWFQDGIKAQDYNSKNGGNFSINSASASDKAPYSCLGKLKSRDVYSKSSSVLNLHVYEAKPEVTLEQNPKHDLMHSGDSVFFNCHVNVSSGWEYQWYKDGSPFASSGSNHSISPVMTEHSGSYTCKVKRGKQKVFESDMSPRVKLDVIERPKASIVLLTGWSEVFSTDSLVLKCEVMESSDVWNYTWFKEDKNIESASSEKHIVTPQNDPDQSVHTCHGIRNERPLYSKTSDSFKTKNLLLKRRVLLAISGCLFFGIIAVLMGCVALRIFRKPAADGDKVEEINLFPTMAQLIADAPCPLVEYITDASLNAPVKEEEENGTVCSETTPLPITKQEDQAATNDSQETTETNGGLLSFQT